MSLFRSILSSSTDRKPYSRAYALPLYNNTVGHEPVTIPRPLTESVHKSSVTPQLADELHASTARLQRVSDRPIELVELDRQERHLQTRLQELLDAQSDCLLAGFGTDARDAAAGESTSGDGDSRGQRQRRGVGSVSDGRRGSTGTYASDDSARREGPRVKVGLSATRRRIYQTMRQLAAVKADEDDILSAVQHDDEQTLDKIEAWERKQLGLRREIEGIEANDRGEVYEQLRADADRLGGEIGDLEMRLVQMRVRHRQMLDEIAGVEDAVQSKLSSYRGSLAALEGNVKAFLGSAPERAVNAVEAKEGGAAFLMLPPARRTLSLAKEYWQDRLNGVERARKGNEVERDALEEGALVWKGVVNTVADSEALLKRELAALAGESRPGEAEQRRVELLKKVDGTLEDLEGQFKLVEEKKWTLLACCVGAELEAFRQGREVLRSLLGPQMLDVGNGDLVDTGTSSRTSPQSQTPASRRSPLRKGRLSSPPKTVPPPVEHVESDDDDPDPELLISHQRDVDDD